MDWFGTIAIGTAIIAGLGLVALMVGTQATHLHLQGTAGDSGTVTVTRTGDGASVGGPEASPLDRVEARGNGNVTITATTGPAGGTASCTIIPDGWAMKPVTASAEGPNRTVTCSWPR